ncbi:MAG: methyltransferase domain-containing protein [Synechococcaceae cyanobacterium SM2_3_1]|nr:methyltransferase domain-containing protein [Synechococcaceae cyanobacterium SM2_3_1]
MLDKDAVTEAVREQYEVFPYPPLGYATPLSKGLSSVSSYILGQYARIHHFCDVKGKRILVAGCGTGSELQVTAFTNPQAAEIIGFDLSQPSISQAKDFIKQHGLSNCKAQFGNLLDPETIPPGQFDMIVAYGVLHHTADPVQALKNLASHLAPDGVMGIMLYNQAGRWPLYQIREAVELLGIHNHPRLEALTFYPEFVTQCL